MVYLRERENESERCERGNEGKVYEGKERVSKRKNRKRGEKKRPEARLLNQRLHSPDLEA